MKLETVDNQLSDMCSEDNVKMIKEACQGLSCETGGLNSGKLWQLKRKLRGIISQPPSAMLDGNGNLITNSQALDELTLEQYKVRLQTLQIREDLKMHQMRRENLCKERLKEAQSVRTPDS